MFMYVCMYVCKASYTSSLRPLTETCTRIGGGSSSGSPAWPRTSSQSLAPPEQACHCRGMYVFMHVCMYVCINVCVCDCMFVCMYVCMYVYRDRQTDRQTGRQTDRDRERQRERECALVVDPRAIRAVRPHKLVALGLKH
jgi:hypothetical protein